MDNLEDGEVIKRDDYTVVTFWESSISAYIACARSEDGQDALHCIGHKRKYAIEAVDAKWERRRKGLAQMGS